MEERRARVRGALRATLRAENILCGVEGCLIGVGRGKTASRIRGPKHRNTCGWLRLNSLNFRLEGLAGGSG